MTRQLEHMFYVFKRSLSIYWVLKCNYTVTLKEFLCIIITDDLTHL